MVLSKIDDSVSYPELKKVYPEDSKMASDLYEIQARGVNIIVAVGSAKDGFKNKGILYYPVYLVKKNRTATQIGVYEILQRNQLRYLNNDNNLDVENLDDPLIYTFATPTYLESKRLVPESETQAREHRRSKKKQPRSDLESGEIDEGTDGDTEEEDDADNKSKNKKSVSVSDESIIIPEQRQDIFILTKGVAIPLLLDKETKADAKDVREKYKEVKEHTWVQKVMKNPHYGIIDNEGDGDCLFATIRDAFSQIAQQTSVAKLRKKLAEEVTPEIFMNYKELYDMYNFAIIKETANIKELAKTYTDIKSKFSNVLDRNEQKMLVENAKQVKRQHDDLVNAKKMTAKLLNEFKFIMLSSEAYAAKDLDNVLQCGQLNDSILENKGEFRPDAYIIVEYTGGHYKLVTYKEKQIFTFAEIPYDIKKLITDKCMERNAGPFAIIPDFIKFKDASPSRRSSNKAVAETKYEDLSEAKLRGVYDDNIVFSFYNNSAAKPLPGKGSGEKIPKDAVKDFTTLAIIPDWRKKLSNTWSQPFTLDNHQWTSVEHYYQASKFKKDNPAFYLSFTLDSGTDLSKDATMAEGFGGTNGKYKGKLGRPKEVVIDPDFFGPRSEKELYDAQYAKFTQNDDLKALIMATNNAKLVHHKRSREPEIYESLMLVRDKIRKEL
jgi:predicted NAD-dependent protein-ADP-ribosyltransferase YbiA (DUF1768 family)